jgi:hypothetical protein
MTVATGSSAASPLNPKQNQILAALPAAEYAWLLPCLAVKKRIQQTAAP